MRLFLRVQYANSYPKGFCMESSMLFIPIVLDENQSIHLLIAETLKDTDYVEFTKKPKFSDMFSDLKTGGTRQIGFVYRVKSEIEDKKVFFDAWVTIYRIEQFPFDQLNSRGQIKQRLTTPEISKWVAVTDALPKEHKHRMSADVLTIAGSKMSVKCYDHELLRWSGSPHVTVKYWMELPEPLCC